MSNDFVRGLEATVNRDVGMLHYKFQPAVSLLLENLTRAYKAGLTKAHFQLFEGYRSPIRQQHVLEQGASKARPFQSAHQYGLAADIVGRVKDAWSWDLADADWRFLKREAGKVGLAVPILNDRCHVQSPLWDKIRKELI